MKSIVPYYAKGYFGQSNDTSNSESRVTLFDRIQAGTFSLEDATLNLDVKNGIGADIRAGLLGFRSVNTRTGNTVAMQHSSVQQIFNVQRATDFPFTPSNYSFEYNKSNSNLISLLENMPNRFDLSYYTELNPFGNISNGNDFVYTDKAIDAHVKLDIPLHFSSNNLTLVDTVYLDHSFEWRYGQTVMNVLADTWPDKYKELVATENDCFYDDRMVQLTLSKLEKEWMIN